MKRLLWLLIALVVVFYGLFEARRLVEGPRVTITSPLDGSATSSSKILVTGTAENVSFLTIDDKPIYTDTSGHFSVTLSPPAGYTIITAAALDRFGRRSMAKARITVLSYCPASPITNGSR